MLYYTQVTFENDTFMIASTEAGLAFIGSPNGMMAELKSFYPKATLVYDQIRNQPYLDQLARYIDGQVDFSKISCDIQGTSFQKRVWHELNNVPCGTTITYSELAKRIGRPQAARAVGSAVGKNPVLIVIPCHRVVAKGKKDSGYRGGLAMKQKLLAHETRILKAELSDKNKKA